MSHNWKNSVKASASRHSSRRGAFSAGLVALVIAVVIAFNLLVGQLPEKYARFDLTDSGIYTVSQTSIDYLAALKTDVVIHVLSNEANMDPRIVRFLDIYDELSQRVSVEYTDPTVYPSVLSTYDCEPSTIVVTCEETGKQKKITPSDIVGIDMYAYYTTQQYIETDFDAEGQLTSAVDLVVSEASRKVYLLNDHGEVPLAAGVEELLQKSHMTPLPLNPLTDGGIPADCDLLLCNTPSSDLADDERDMILDYLAQGGQVVYLMRDDFTPRPNWDAVLQAYGMEPVEGIIADTQRFYNNDLYTIFPAIDTTADIAAELTAEDIVLLYGTRGMTLTDPAREGITTTAVLSTSEGGMAIVDENNRTEGVFVAGATATEDTANGVARLTVFGSNSLIDEGITSSFSNLANLKLFMSAVTVGFDDIASISVEPVSLQVTQNTITTGGIWSALFILVLPLAALLIGFVRWVHRRKL